METFLEDIAQVGGKELMDDVIAEFRLGWNFEKVMAEKEMMERAEVSTSRTSGGVDGLGRVTMDVPATSYHFWMNWGRKHGIANIWKDPQFRKDYARDNPGSKVKYQSLKPRQGWTPARESHTTNTSGLVMASKYTSVKGAA